MAGFTVDLEALIAAVDQMSQFEKQLEQSLGRAKASVQSLGLSWHGDAASAQQAAQEQWNSAPKNCAPRLVSCGILPSRRTATTREQRRTTHVCGHSPSWPPSLSSRKRLPVPVF